MASRRPQRWVVDAVEEFITWLAEQDQDTQEKVVALRRLLEQHGPTLGRPYVDRIKGSRRHNLKELRPSSSEAEALRILFYFDPRRQALLLVGGDKAGNWHGWYEQNIPLAEARIDRHEAALPIAASDATTTETRERDRRAPRRKR